KPAAAARLPSLFRAALRTGMPRAMDGLVYDTTVACQVKQQGRDVRISARNDRLLVTFRDVTERRRSEDDVRRSEECLRALVDDVADEALVTVDPDGNVASWNTGAESLYGYASAEI